MIGANLGNPYKTKLLKEEYEYYQIQHNISKRAQCALCKKVAKIPARVPMGGRVIKWDEFRLLPLSSIPDYSQFCHRKYCYELRLALMEDEEEREAQDLRKRQLEMNEALERKTQRERELKLIPVPCISDNEPSQESSSD